VSDKVSDFIAKLKSKSDLDLMDEAATKQAILLPLLQLLGWDVFDVDEVFPEFSIKGKNVDYCLRIMDENKVFIEAKRVRESLDNHEEQLVGYAFREGVRLAILTNGLEWRFYLPLEAGSWERRNFYTINMLEQATARICEKLLLFLAKANVENESAVVSAQALLSSRKRMEAIRKALPEAWRRIIAEPDDLLAEIIADKTEAVCGYRPEPTDVKPFIDSLSQLTVDDSRNTTKRSPIVEATIKASRASGQYTGKRIVAFSFDGTRYPAKYWISMLTTLCEILALRNPTEFERVTALRGDKMRYFSKNPQDLVNPKKIEGTSIYAEAKLNADSIVRNAHDVLKLLGYKENDITLEIE
jgi:predicted type IV restriction endonuclease